MITNKLKPFMYNSMLGFLPIVVYSSLVLFLPVLESLIYSYVFSVLFILIAAKLMVPKRIYQFGILLSFFTLSLLAAVFHVPQINIFVSIPIFAMELLWATTLLIALFFKDHLFQFVNVNFKPTVRADIRSYLEQLYQFISVTLVVLSFHFGLAILYILFAPTTYNHSLGYTLFYQLPLVLMFLLALYEQFRIYFFMREEKKDRYVYVVDDNALGIGKILYSEAIKPKNVYCNPYVRIAIIQNKMIYLSKNSDSEVHDPGLIDIPVGDYINYGESLDSTINRLIESTNLDPNHVRVVNRHHFVSAQDNRMIFLSVVFLEDDFKLVVGPDCMCSGKFWTQKQIESEMTSGIFSPCFIEEYPRLQKEILQGRNENEYRLINI